MNKINIWHKIRIILMSLTIIGFMVIGFLIYLRPIESEIEKRKLAVFPTLTFSTVFDGSFFKDIVSWYADTYPLREKMIAFQSETEQLYGIRDIVIYGDTAKTADEIPEDDTEAAPVISDIAIDESLKAEVKEEKSDDNQKNNVSKDDEKSLTTENPAVSVHSPDEKSIASSEISKDKKGDSKASEGSVKIQPEVSGTVYISGNIGFTLYYFYKEGADLYASMLNTAAKKASGIATVYDIVVPNSFGVNLDEDIQESMNTSNQGEAINYIYKKLDKSIKTVETYNTLRSHNKEYLYFRTDHHWTALGAYYVYRNFCEVKGIKPHELSEFEKKEFKGFLGTFYASSNQSKALAQTPDTVEAFVPMGTNKELLTPQKGEPYQYNIISDADQFSAANKYLTFIGGDRPITEITNPDINDDTACIIVKESYGNAFVPFLVDHYQYVYIIDYRYFGGNIIDLAKKHSKTDIIFLNNTAAATVEKSKLMLGILK